MVQLSLDSGLAAKDHFPPGARLAPLRDDGILLIGSGNIVHNMRMMKRTDPDRRPHRWAETFETANCTAVEARDHRRLMNFSILNEVARLSVSTHDHFWLLLCTAGAGYEDDRPELLLRSIQHASISNARIAWWPQA